MKQNVETKQK